MSTGFTESYSQWRESLVRLDRFRKVFVLGCAKSGTTWVGDLLNAHEQVVLRGEGGFGWRLAPILMKAFEAFNDHQKNMDPITQLREADLLFTMRALVDGQLWRYLCGSGRDLSQVQVVGDKTPQHTMAIPALRQIYPDARFIHVLRDPRDTAVSAWFHFGPGDGRPFAEYIEYFISRAWPLNVATARKSSAILGSAYLEVRYEDLKQEPLLHVARLFEHLGVDSGGAAVESCIAAASFEKKSGGRAPGQEDNRSFYRSGVSGAWRKHIPLPLADRCCAAIAPLMLSCGYEPAAEQAAAV